MKQKLNYILLLIIVIFVALLSIANIQSVKVNYLFGEFKMPLILLILLSVLAGSLIASLLGFTKNFSLKSELKKTRKDLASLNDKHKEELEQLAKTSSDESSSI